MRKGFLLRVVCFGVTLLMVIRASWFSIGCFDVVYAETCVYLTHFMHSLENYQIIVFLCVCILLCNLANKMKWMWVFSVGLALYYPLIRRIDLLERRLAILTEEKLKEEREKEEKQIKDNLTFTDSS